MKYAEIALNAAIQQTFTYRVPDALAGRMAVGQLVRVPFRTAVEPGIVVRLHDDDAPEIEIKDVEAVLDPDPVVTQGQIALSLWLSETIYAPPGPCIWLWLPSGLVGQSDVLYALGMADFAPVNALQMRIIELLTRRGPLRKRQIAPALKAVTDSQLAIALHALIDEGALSAQPVLSPPGVRPQKIQTVALAIHPLAIQGAAPHLGKQSALYLHILRLLARHDKPVDVSWVYAQVEGAALKHLKRLAELQFVTLGEKETWRDSLAKREFNPVAPPALTPGQAAAWAHIERALKFKGGRRALLLHGVTGSGKTELYLRAIALTLAAGRDALMLVPEIAMTPQLVRRVVARFPGEVAIVHSQIGAGELYDTWRRAREGLVRVIVGTRSALFAPLPDIGLICIDEEHDDSYRNMVTPHYDVRHVAEEMMARADGLVILGSATPGLETYARALEGHYDYLRLPDRIMSHRIRVEAHAEREGVRPRYAASATEGDDDAGDALTIALPPVQIVDMREELKSGNTSIFSRLLTSALDLVLRERQQAILFLNRRGTATYVFCRDCGYMAACPRCDSPLTYHGYGGDLQCHHCGLTTPTPSQCPQCGSARIRYFGAGTQQVEAALAQFFPGARVVRWDSDTASRPDLHDAILDRFLRREADIMVGTQLVAKGLDLPLVTLVGVVSADTGLGLPDFRAAERTFQLLTQVAGRAGRGILGGQVILQTYQPDHYAIQAAAGHDTLGFYARELDYRRQLGYPPYRRLARVIFRHTREPRAREEAVQAAGLLREQIAARQMTATELIGPSPCFFARVNEQYRWQVLIRSPDPLALLRSVEPARTWSIELDPLDLL